MPRRNKKLTNNKRRTHTNNHSLRYIKSGKCREDVKRMAKKLGIEYRDLPQGNKTSK